MANMVYVIGNESNQSERIMSQLGINISDAVSLADYIPDKSDCAILISSGGHHHGDTAILSAKLHKSGIIVDAKIIYDQHLDFFSIPAFDAEYEKKKIRMASLNSPEKYNCYLESRRQFASHAFTVYEAGYLETLLLLGICGKDPLQVIQNRINEYENRWSFQKTDIIVSSKIQPPKNITGKNVLV